MGQCLVHQTLYFVVISLDISTIIYKIYINEHALLLFRHSMRQNVVCDMNLIHHTLIHSNTHKHTFIDSFNGNAFYHFVCMFIFLGDHATISWSVWSYSLAIWTQSKHSMHTYNHMRSNIFWWTISLILNHTFWDTQFKYESIHWIFRSFTLFSLSPSLCICLWIEKRFDIDNQKCNKNGKIKSTFFVDIYS